MRTGLNQSSIIYIDRTHLSATYCRYGYVEDWYCSVFLHVKCTSDVNTPTWKARRTSLNGSSFILITGIA